MARFLDKRTGQIVKVFKRPQIVNRRQRRDRYEEITDDTPAPTPAAEFAADHIAAAAREVAAELNVPDAVAWAGDNPDRQRALVAAEREGKRRKGILEAFT